MTTTPANTSPLVNQADQGVRSSYARLVVKLGTSTLSDATGSPDSAYLADLAGQVAALAARDIACVIVTSGAIRAGRDLLTLPHAPKSIPIKQAAAAVGQGRLMQLYADAFRPHGIVVGQILLTRDDFHHRKRYVHASNTIRAMLKLGIVPIVNENDTIAVEEIKVGDNDTLAALVAGLVGADLLILLSDIEGLYTVDPNADPSAELIRVVSRIDKSIEDSGRGSKGDWGTGGMRTKIEAAKICTRSHIPMVIAKGRNPNVLNAVLQGEMGTRFEPHPATRGMNARKRWIAGGQRASGALQLHEAACKQLIERGRSLLPAGVTEVRGPFDAGDLVVLLDPAGHPIGRGIVNYSHEDLTQIKGLRTADVKALLGETATDEVIHRDNMVVTASP